MGNKTIEIPCDIGDKIYYVTKNGIYNLPVTRLQYIKGLTPPSEFIIEIMYKEPTGNFAPEYKELSLNSYGVLWFTDEGKAKQKHKELKSKQPKLK